MAELTHRALRELIEDFGGCDEYFSEMLSAAAVVSGGPFERYYLDGGPCAARLVYQLCGADSAVITAAAALLDARECAGIDINMGCSAPAITRTGAGAAWLSRGSEAWSMAGSVRKKTKKRLSVKLRIGVQDDFENLLQFCKNLEAEGVDLITLHPRTTKEKFKRRVRWHYITRLSAALKIPVAGNGDIDSLETAQRHIAEGGCAALMIGRLAVREPWVFARIKAAGNVGGGIDIEAAALRFLELLTKYQPPEFFQSRALRFFQFYCGNVIWGEYLKNLLAHESTLPGFSGVLRRYFNEHPEERFL